MTKFNEGFTSIYNRFHNPHEQSSEILHLREHHARMDKAVLNAYGWQDLAKTAHCEFLISHEVDNDSGDEDQGSGTGKRQKKKPWRLRWPDDFRDEVLARLLELNQQRHKEELLAGKITTKRNDNDDATNAEDSENAAPKTTITRKKKASPKKSDQVELNFGNE